MAQACAHRPLRARVPLSLLRALLVLLMTPMSAGAADLGTYINLDIPHTAIGSKGQTPLMQAAQRADLARMESLLSGGADINVPNKTGGTALMYAALSGDPGAVRLLLTRGAAVNAAAANGWTALMIAAVKGYEPIVQLLLSAGADVNKADIYGWTPLMRAIHEGRTAVAQALLEAPSLDVARKNEHGATALHYAAAAGDLRSAQLLLQRGADANARDTAGHTPRILAAQNNHLALVALFQKYAH